MYVLYDSRLQIHNIIYYLIISYPLSERLYNGLCSCVYLQTQTNFYCPLPQTYSVTVDNYRPSKIDCIEFCKMVINSLVPLTVTVSEIFNNTNQNSAEREREQEVPFVKEYIDRGELKLYLFLSALALLLFFSKKLVHLSGLYQLLKSGVTLVSIYYLLNTLILRSSYTCSNISLPLNKTNNCFQ